MKWDEHVTHEQEVNSLSLTFHSIFLKSEKQKLHSKNNGKIRIKVVTNFDKANRLTTIHDTFESKQGNKQLQF